jgi:hypothetical protein
MKQQIERFSPHQNGKVFAVLVAVSSLVFLVPLFFIVTMFAPEQSRPPMLMLLAMPVLYLVFGYISVAIGCAMYNLLFRFIGGIEFETRTDTP